MPLCDACCNGLDELMTRPSADGGTDDGMTIYSLAWAQGVGCGIMGLALARKNEIIAVYVPPSPLVLLLGDAERVPGITDTPHSIRSLQRELPGP
jgi:hypothetical protein